MQPLFCISQIASEDNCIYILTDLGIYTTFTDLLWKPAFMTVWIFHEVTQRTSWLVPGWLNAWLRGRPGIRYNINRVEQNLHIYIHAFNAFFQRIPSNSIQITILLH